MLITKVRINLGVNFTKVTRKELPNVCKSVYMFKIIIIFVYVCAWCLCVGTGAHRPWTHAEARGQLSESVFSFHWVFQKANSHCQTRAENIVLQWATFQSGNTFNKQISTRRNGLEEERHGWTLWMYDGSYIEAAHWVLVIWKYVLITINKNKKTTLNIKMEENFSGKQKTFWVE